MHAPKLLWNIICAFVLSVLYKESNSQSNTLHQLDSTFRNEKNIGNIRFTINSDKNYLEEIKNGDNKLLDKVTYTRNKIHFNINGTGTLFTHDDQYKLIRLDSTKYNGNSFGAFFTNYQDTVLLLGGYGFWETNGALRFFNEKFNEWDIYKSNENIRFAGGVNSIIYEDRIRNKIYVIFQETTPEYVQAEEKPFVSLQCLDLKTKKWWEETKIINPEIASHINELKEFAYGTNELILGTKYKNKVLILNFDKNKCYSISDNTVSEIIQTKNKEKDYLTFSSSNGYNIYSLSNQKLIRFQFKLSDQTSLDLALFKNPPSSLKNKSIWGSIIPIIFLLIILGYIVSQKVKKKSEKNNDFNTTHDVVIKFEEIFDETEKNIIKHILSNQKKLEKNTSIDEINILLDIVKKPLKIQNNIRADVISNINKKFSIYLTTNDLIIERIRSNFDKRFFEYKLNRKYLQKLDKI